MCRVSPPLLRGGHGPYPPVYFSRVWKLLGIGAGGIGMDLANARVVPSASVDK